MAALVAVQLEDARDSLGRKVLGNSNLAQPVSNIQLSPNPAQLWLFLPRGKYSIQGSRVALTLSSLGVSATTLAALDGVFQVLGFENYERREVPVPVSPAARSARSRTHIPRGRAFVRLRPGFGSCSWGFLQELGWFREQLNALRGPVGCALVAWVVPTGQLRQPQPLVLELSRCRALQGCPKILMLSGDLEGCVAYRDEKGSDFIQTLVEVLRANPGGDLLELLTKVNRRLCELDILGPDGDELQKTCLEIGSSLRRRLCLQDGRPC